MAQRLVLSVEDNDAAFHLLKVAFQETQPAVRLVRVADGEQALAFLHQRDRFRDVPRPVLVLLNFNLPTKSGLEVLREMAAHESLRSIPVVVFTSSANAAEKAKCLALGAREFMTKPNNFDGLLDAVNSAYGRASA